MRRLLLLSALFLLPEGAFSQVPFGPEFQVTARHRPGSSPSVVSDQVGNFVVVWQGVDGAGDRAIFAQRFDHAGRAVGGEFQINSSTSEVGYPPAVAGAPDGRFVVTWNRNFDGIVARRFDASGAPVGSDFAVNTYTTYAQFTPDVGMDAAGNFVVVWTSILQDGDRDGVFGQRFDSAGNRRGAEFRVNASTTGDQNVPKVAVAPSGRFFVVWSGYGPGINKIFGRGFDAQGVPSGPEFRLSAYSTTIQFGQQVSADGAGNFVAVWEDVNRHVIGGRRCDASGSPVGVEFAIAGVSPYLYPFAPAVAADPNGTFVVAWSSFDNDFAQRHDANGPLGPVVRLNRYRFSGLRTTALTSWPGRGFVAAWPGADDFGQPFGVFARRFAELGPAALVVDVTGGPSADGNGVLEAGESVSVAPSWLNSTPSARVAAGSASEITGPGSPSLYSIPDGAAGYSSLPAGGTGSCLSAPDCYAVGVGVPATRPALHWDARVREDFLYGFLLPTIWTLHVGESFGDVPRSSPFYRFVEALLHHEVTAGCGAGAFCPQGSVSRDQMAVFVLRGSEPPWFEPFHCAAGQERFTDVPFSSPYCPWIEELERRGVVTGCAPGLYCPGTPVTREQMAVFLLLTLDARLRPPACTTPLFADVPAGSPFCRWIEELARRGISAGCGGGNYCPTAAVTREEMAAFLSATFGLTLYGP